MEMRSIEYCETRIESQHPVSSVFFFKSPVRIARFA